MEVKERVRNRLTSLDELTGVFPTAPVEGENLLRFARAAESLMEERLDEARSISDSVLQRSAVGGNAIDLFTGSRELREQAAAFTQAGIGFFYGSATYDQLPMAERAARGGSGIVSRMFMQGSRLLLEPQRLIVSFHEKVSRELRDTVLAQSRLFVIQSDGLPPNSLRVACPDGFAVNAALALMEREEVRFAEPDFIEHIGKRYIPFDPDYSTQWHHALINANVAWDLTRGEEVHVVVIDNGFDVHHQDLSFGPLSGAFRPTRDLVDSDFVPGLGSIPDSRHGTACAGMIGAIQDNGIGGCGVAPRALLSVVSCMNDQVGSQSTLARAIGYATDPSTENPTDRSQGADVISCSLGPNGASWTMRQVLSDAIDFATTRGRSGRGSAIFWACTNGNFPISADEVCSHPSVLAVGRSTSLDNDHACGFGDELSFLAPGVDVLIPDSGGGYGVVTGTSFAAPCAAGVAALVLSRNANLTVSRLRRLLETTCDKIGGLPYVRDRNVRFGYGRINAANAVKAALSPPP